MAQLDHEGGVIGRGDAHLVLACGPGQPLGRAADDAEHVGRRGSRRRVEQAQPRAAHVLGGERRPVAELEALAELELVGQPIRADLPP